MCIVPVYTCVCQTEREEAQQLIYIINLASAKRVILADHLVCIWGLIACTVVTDESTQATTVRRAKFDVVSHHRATVSHKVDFSGHTYELPIPLLTKGRQVMNYCKESRLTHQPSVRTLSVC